MIYTNENKTTSSVREMFQSHLVDAVSLDIASGYVSGSTIDEFSAQLMRIAQQRGRVRLLVGLALYQGLTSKVHNRLAELNKSLRVGQSGSGVYIAYQRPFHGKIYSFLIQDGSKSSFVGSANFSATGFGDFCECVASIDTENSQTELQAYIDRLFSDDFSCSIDKANIKSRGKVDDAKVLPLSLDNLARHTRTLDVKLPFFEFRLEHLDEKSRSGLNVYFGKGRKNKKTGVVKPRPWFEAELIASKKQTSNKLYPHGDFVAYTDDGYVIEMRSQGDYNKNIRSKKRLTIFGEWIKTRLQNASALELYQPITEDVLERYGNNRIRFYKIRKGEYFMEFAPNP